MGYSLSNETKKNIFENLGIPYEEFIKMDDEEIEKYIEERNGKKLSWPKDKKVDGLPIRTMKEIDTKIDSLIVKNDK